MYSNEGKSLEVLVLTSEFLLKHICWLDLASTFLYFHMTSSYSAVYLIRMPPGISSWISILTSSFQFVVGSELVSIRPTSWVQQGDGLSSIIFNLAAEPLLRCAKVPDNADVSLFCSFLKATAYADDISLVGSYPADLLSTLDGMLWRALEVPGPSSQRKAMLIPTLIYLSVRREFALWLRVSMRTILLFQWVREPASLSARPQASPINLF